MKRFSNSQYKSPPPPYQYAQCDHASHSPAKQGGVLVSVPPPPATPPVPSFQREGGVIGSVSSFASVCLSPSVSLCLPLSRAHACMRALSFLPHTLSERKCLLYHSPPPHTGTWTRRGRILGSHALRSAYGGEITRVHCPALLRSVQLTSCSMPANVALRSCRRASAMHAHTHAHIRTERPRASESERERERERESERERERERASERASKGGLCCVHA